MKSKNNRLLKPIQHLADAIEASGNKIIAGLQPDQIERIEAERCRRNLSTTTDGSIDVVYNKFFWDELGKEFSWHPFTLALCYFEHKSLKQPAREPNPLAGDITYGKKKVCTCPDNSHCIQKEYMNGAVWLDWCEVHECFRNPDINE